MKNLSFVLGLAAAGTLWSDGLLMDLDWNVRYSTAVPYEVELSPAKLEKLAGVAKGSGFRVEADGSALPVAALRGKAPETVDLRFAVPAGTKKLTCTAGVGTLALTDTARLDNLFAAALDPANRGGWTLDKNVTATYEPGGLFFAAKAYGNFTVSYTVDLPANLAGRPAKVEFDLTSRTRLAWGGNLRVRQLDADGRELPDSVSDPRWTCQMRPFNKLTQYREDGVFHPKARKLRFELGLNSIRRSVDEYGLPCTDDRVFLATVLLSHVAVRPAAVLPFPKYDDQFFPSGVTSAPGDAALALGGPAAGGFWYQTHSQACWAEDYAFRDEADCFFPAGAGTVEAWFKSDWKKMDGAIATFFHYHQGYVASERRDGKETFLALSWRPSRSTLTLELQDAAYKKFSATADKIRLPDNVWFHLAVTWAPGGKAFVFLDGKKILSADLADFKAFDLADRKVKHPCDLAGMELFVGVRAHGARLKSTLGQSAGHRTLEGAVDALRVSSGCRYAEDFTPAKDYGPLDAATRARFDFDRSFDGVSAGDSGFILGSYRADTDRIDHKLQIGGRTVQYFPAANLPENDPAVVLDIHNYPVLPKPAEYTAARRDVKKSFDVKPGDVVGFDAPAGAYPDYVEVANTGASPLVYPIAVGKGELDVRSFGDLAEGLSLGGASDREKANRLFQLVISGSDYFMNHNAIFPYGSDDPQSVCYDAMVVFNSYCGFECGPLNNMAANMFAAVANCPAVQTGGYGHSFEEVFYDGKNHIYDLSAQKFFPAMDNETAAYLREVGDQPGLHNRVHYSPDHFMRKGTRGHWAQSPDYRPKIGVVLNPGEAFRVWRGNNGQGNNLQCKNAYGRKFKWDEPGYTAVWAPRYEKETHAKEAKNPIRRIDRFFPDFSNGFITFDGRPAAANPAFTNVTADSFCYHIRTGYPITWARYAAYLADGRPAPLEICTDFRTFRPLPAPGADGATTLDYLVRARHGYWIRVKAPIDSIARFVAATEVIVNRRTFPGHVKPGANELTFKAVSGEKARLTVQWRENAGDIRLAGGVFSGTIPGFERQTVLLDPAQPLALAVEGAADATASATAGLTATLADGTLVVAAKDAKTKPFIGAVTIDQGGAKRELTVVVCAGARLALAKDGQPFGQAKIVPPDADRVQAAALLTEEGDGVALTFAPLPAGRYFVFNCERFEGGLTKGENGARVLQFQLPGAKKGEWEASGAAANGNCDFLKAPYGRKGMRGNWKWDYPYVQESRSSSWSGWEIKPLDFAATDTLRYRLSAKRPNGVELAAALIVPATVTQDFRGELKKIFCGLDCQPFRIVAQ